ncbi:uncharacterized protein EV154DRAFT_517890, partial [Mucor mucedo]|uniref:uncharacterized protein n=1 Tax=Mucor mucedo TaxID=29922 RepID=UPI0022211756
MIQQKQGILIVQSIYPCYICAKEFIKAKEVIRHVKKAHGYILVAQDRGHRGPADELCAYAMRGDEIWRVQDQCCPSCWYHAPKINGMEQLMEHIMEVHEPERVEGFINPDGEENELMDIKEEEKAPVKGEEVESEAKVNTSKKEALIQAIKLRMKEAERLLEILRN